MRRGATIRLFASALFGAALLSACTTINPRHQNAHVLQIVAPGTGRVVFETPIRPGEEFEISYVHSVSNSPVTGYFRAADDAQIQPVGTEFNAFGPGLPWAAEQIERRPDGSLYVPQTDDPVRDELRIWVSSTTADVFRIRGDTIALTVEGDSPRLIVIRVSRQTR